MIPWYHDTLVPWYRGIMASCHRGTIPQIQWYHDIMVLTYHDTVPTWNHGTMGPLPNGPGSFVSHGPMVTPCSHSAHGFMVYWSSHGPVVHSWFHGRPMVPCPHRFVRKTPIFINKNLLLKSIQKMWTGQNDFSDITFFGNVELCCSKCRVIQTLRTFRRTQIGCLEALGS